jgi:23S rRNA (adenine2030-N6)-methyltransferase
MNYRHAFHAGNFADVLKHVVLARILVHLRAKPAPFRVIDTHAGAGLYDLAGAEAGLTGEWRHGIGRLAAATLPQAAADLLAPYLAALATCNPDGGLRFYPGSPLIVRDLLRPNDRFIACETEPGAAAALAVRLRAAPDRKGDKAQIKVTPIDGWTALNAYVPVKERRGLVMIDPPFEQSDDFLRLASGVVAAYRKWPTGIYMLWYPVKERAGPDRLAAAVRDAGIEKTLHLELSVAAPPPDGGLTQCGLVIINPPWTLAAEAAILLPALANILGRDHGRSYRIGTTGDAVEDRPSPPARRTRPGS